MLEELREKFFLLASVSKSVVFARAEPAMKKKMVTEVIARNPEVTTLAIGDGANDTGSKLSLADLLLTSFTLFLFLDMIQAAHIGVGIAGIEGTAATNASDYAIGTFRMLHTLIFVHGHWNYVRISKLVCYIFYKAVMMAMCSYYFGPDSAFSGAQYFNDPPVQVCLHKIIVICLSRCMMQQYTSKPFFCLRCTISSLPLSLLSCWLYLTNRSIAEPSKTTRMPLKH